MARSVRIRRLAARHHSARAFDNMILLTPEAVHDTLKEFFPAKNDDFATGYVEELAELRAFGIATQEQLRELLRRRADEVMEIDRSPMSESDIQMHRQASGEELVASRLREGLDRKSVV